ncbi:MAG TPA: hypothetical protein VMC80_00895 [Patescibacteria group bacterium]|nr:hypothetical protein [Patescibacteria group bacterium]
MRGNTNTIIFAVYLAFGLYLLNSYFKFLDLSKIISGYSVTGIAGIITVIAGILLILGGLNFLRKKNYYPERR